MPRFQLRILEPGREQSRLVRLESPVVVGRSARADVAVDDKELGRKQFRIGEDRGFVVLEALGTTNATLVDGRALQAGERTTVVAGSRICVGKTEFMIEVCEQTAEMRTPGKSPEDDTDQVVTDATMVKGFRPGAAPPPAPPPAAADDGFEPGVTMARGFRPGGAPPPPAQPPAAPPPSDDVAPDVTMAKGFRPGAAPPPQPAPPPSDDVAPDVTMVGGFRPGGAPPPQPAKPPAAPPPSGEAAPDVTMVGGFRPGAAPPSPPAERPAAQPPTDDAAPDVTMVGGFRPGGAPPPPAAPQAQPSAAAPTPDAPAPASPQQPTSAPAEPAPVDPSAAQAAIQTWQPRLFLKGVGLKRTIALTSGRSRIGQAGDAEVSIPHESVAERHADICFDGERWTLLDMGSQQGSNVDGAAVRSEARALRHNSLIAVGAARAVFLCVDPGHASADRRAEQRALGLLTKRGDLHQSDVRELRERCGDGSMAEVVLRDTGVSAEQWAAATREARERPSLLGRILRLFGIGR